MRIAFLAFEFPAWTETFIRRYVCALRDLDHTIHVFVDHDPPSGPHITMPVKVTKAIWEPEAIKKFAPDVLYGSLSLRALQTTIQTGRRFVIPYVLQVWSGLDTFRHTVITAKLLGSLGDDRLCRAIMVEDGFMAAWAVNRLGVTPAKLLIVPNSLDLDSFRNCVRNERNPLTVLNVSRFIAKKGLIYLVVAMSRCDADLWLVGDGVERGVLEKAASDRVRFLGIQPESNLASLYSQAAVYAAPCIRAVTGDGDGVPTTVLEAMACGCPIVASDLLSMSQYVIPKQTGLLVPPGDAVSLAAAINSLLKDQALRYQLGEGGRAFAVEHLDIRKNIKTIEGALRG